MSLSRYMGDLFEEPFTTLSPFFGTNKRGVSPWGGEWGSQLENFRPQTDISETDKEILIKSNVPGLKKEDIKIDVDDLNRTLTFSGETKSEKRDDTEVYHRVERSYGKFSRSVRLPKNTDFDNIKANMDQGVLNIAIPKKVEQTKTRAVNIQ